MSHPRAPRPGTVLARSDAVPTGGSASVTIDGFGVLLVRGADGLRAFVNACPHQYLPLDWRKAEVLSADGARILCSNHGAVFDADSGHGIAGFGQGCELDGIPVIEANGEIRIDPAA